MMSEMPEEPASTKSEVEIALVGLDELHKIYELSCELICMVEATGLIREESRDFKALRDAVSEYEDG